MIFPNSCFDVNCLVRRLERVRAECYLCGQRFSLTAWRWEQVRSARDMILLIRRGRHRRECSWRHARRLNMIPSCQGKLLLTVIPSGAWNGLMGLFTLTLAIYSCIISFPHPQVVAIYYSFFFLDLLVANSYSSKSVSHSSLIDSVTSRMQSSGIWLDLFLVENSALQ